METMTIKQLAEVAGVDERTVRRTIDEIYPGLLRNGVKTELNFDQAEAVMHNIKIKGGVQSVPRQNAEVQNLPSSQLSSLDLLAQMVKVLQEQEAKQKETDRRLIQLEAKIETKFTSEFEDQLVTPTELGQMLTPKVTAQAVNRLLQSAGLQYKVGKAWVSSASGNRYSYNEPIQKEGVGMIYQLKWQRRVKDLL